MCSLENATVKLILNDSKHVVSICKIKLESEMKKHFVFFRHISFIFQKSYYRLLYSEFQPERNEIR